MQNDQCAFAFLAVLLSLCALTTPAAARTPACAAPSVQSHIAVPNASCDQQWQYALYRQYVLKYFPVYGAVLDAAIGKRDATREVNDLYLTQAQIVTDFPGSRELAAWTAKQYMSVLIDALPADSSAQTAAKELSQTAVDVASTSASGAANATVDVTLRLAKLMNNSFALSDIQDLVAKRNGLLVAQQYLGDLYSNGGSSSRVAMAYGLASNTRTRDVLATIALRLTGTARGGSSVSSWLLGYTDYIYTSKIIASAQQAIAQHVSCMTTGCGPLPAQTATSRVMTTEPAVPSPPPAVPTPASSSTVIRPEIQDLVRALTGQARGDRVTSLATLLLAGRIPQQISPAELNVLVGPPQENWRPSIMQLLARQLRHGLTPADVLSVLGDSAAGDRYSMLSALVLLQAINPLSTADIATLSATFGGWSSSATTLLAGYRPQ